MWDRRTATLALGRPAAKSGHFGVGASLVDKDQTLRVKVELAVEPLLALGLDVWACLFCRVSCFFCVSGRAWRRSTRPLTGRSEPHALPATGQQPGSDFMERDVLVGSHKIENEAFKRIKLRARWVTQPGRFQRAFGPPLLVPLDRRGWRDGKPCRRSTCRHSLVNRRHTPTTKLDSIGPCHIYLPQQDADTESCVQTQGNLFSTILFSLNLL